MTLVIENAIVAEGSIQELNEMIQGMLGGVHVFDTDGLEVDVQVSIKENVYE